jgi:transposase
MPRTRAPYSPEFRRQMVDLVRAGRSPEDFAREFEPTAQSIGAWVAAADKQEGRREEAVPGLAVSERDELARLRRGRDPGKCGRVSIRHHPGSAIAHAT